MEGIVLAGNHKMLGLMHALGFSVRSEPGDASVKHLAKHLTLPSSDPPRMAGFAADVN
jgi:hypothetical protein